MSTITSAISPSNQTPMIQVPDRIYSGDRALFAREFNKRSFALQHSLSAHPAFSMHRLHSLLERSLLEPGKVYWNAGKKRIDQRWEDQPGRDFSVEEAFRRIRETDAWIIIFGAERDEEIHALLQRGMAELEEMSGISLAKEAKNTETIIFITSPNRVTNYHIDRECSLLMQIHGKKIMHVFDKTDREVLPEEELEKFWTVDNNAPLYKPHLQDRATTYQLEPGVAVHIPTNAPHWLQNGDDISVSVNQNFQYFDETLANIYRANYYARKIGLNPLPPGHSAFSDRLKGPGMKIPIQIGRKIMGLRRRLRRSSND